MLVAVALFHLSEVDASALLERTSTLIEASAVGGDRTSRYRIDSDPAVDDVKMRLLQVDPMPCQMRWQRCPSRPRTWLRTPLPH